jgi:hypothetical protein
MPTLIRLLKPLEIITGCLLIIFLSAGVAKLLAQEDDGTKKKLAITQAVMCEEIRDYEPQNRAVVFSISMGKVYCFTAFDPVPRNMYVYHSWYRQDRLITTRRLSLKTPAWSVFSTVQLRQADKGPWRVEVKDHNGGVIKILKFSITD